MPLAAKSLNGKQGIIPTLIIVRVGLGVSVDNMESFAAASRRDLESQMDTEVAQTLSSHKMDCELGTDVGRLRDASDRSDS